MNAQSSDKKKEQEYLEVTKYISPKGDFVFMNATDLKKSIQITDPQVNLSIMAIARVLRELGYRKDSHNGKDGYWLRVVNGEILPIVPSG